MDHSHSSCSFTVKALILILFGTCASLVCCGETGTLTGKISFEGPLPEVFAFDLTSAPASLPVCSGGKSNQKNAQRLSVDPDTHGVASVVVRLTTLKDGIPSPPKPFPTKHKPLIDQVACEFTPMVEWVEAGQSLRIHSSDATMHNVHAYKEQRGGETLFNDAMPEKDKTITKRLSDPGLVVLGCDAGHIWMCAYVFVTENPYIELSAKDGSFKMEGIPPGQYRVSFWQAGWSVTPGPNDLKTGKPSAYSYSAPLVLETPIEIKPGENKLDALLTKEGWKK